jgi:hypothetical protein
MGSYWALIGIFFSPFVRQRILVMVIGHKVQQITCGNDYLFFNASYSTFLEKAMEYTQLTVTPHLVPRFFNILVFPELVSIQQCPESVNDRLLIPFVNLALTDHP